MSLQNRATGLIFDVPNDQIYTGASTHYLYTPPNGKRACISDFSISAADNAEVHLFFMATGANSSIESNIKRRRRIYLAANGNVVENRTLPINGAENESIMFRVVTADAAVTIGVSGEYIP